MTPLQSLAVCGASSALLSLALLAVIASPLRGLLEQVCAGEAAVRFWLRFALAMLVLAPLFTAVAFGTPAAGPTGAVDLGRLVRSAVTASVSGAFLAMFGLGLWVSALIRRANGPAGVAWAADRRRSSAGGSRYE